MITKNINNSNDEQSNEDDDQEDEWEDDGTGREIEDLDRNVEMTASGDDYGMKIYDTEPYLSFHKIKVSKWYPNTVDPVEMVRFQQSVDIDLIDKTKKWAKQKGLILLNEDPQWFNLVHFIYFDK